MSEINCSNLINSYALVQASWLKEDYISSFIPLMEGLIVKKNYDSIDLQLICSDFLNEYGFEIPAHPATKILSMLQKNGMLTYNKEIRKWFPDYTKLSNADITNNSCNLMNKFQGLMDDFSKFSKDKYGYEIKSEKTQEAFLTFIQHNSDFAFNMEQKDISFYKEEHRIIASFLDSIHSNVESFNIVKKIAIGKLLVDAIEMKETQNEKNDFDDVSVFLDTRIILYLIGFYGDYREKTYCDLISNLKSKGAKLYVFSHTLKEIDQIFAGCEKWIGSSEYNPELASSALRYLYLAQKDKKYVQCMITSLQSKLDQFEICEYNDSISKEDYNYEISRKELKEKIIDCYKRNEVEITKRILETIEYDIDSIEKIYHIRKNESTRYLTETKAFLLTTNRNLVYASKQYSKVYYGDAIQSCIGAITIGTFLWARSGIKKCENAIELKLISDCASAMEPSPREINQFCKKISELREKNAITDAQFVALRSYGLNTEAAKPVLVKCEEFEYNDIFEAMDEIRQDAIKHEKTKYDRLLFDAESSRDQAILEKESAIKESKENKIKILTIEEEKTKNQKIFEENAKNNAKKADRIIKLFQIWINFLINGYSNWLICNTCFGNC